MIIILEGHFDDLVQWLILTYSMKAGVLDIHRWFYTVNTVKTVLQLDKNSTRDEEYNTCVHKTSPVTFPAVDALTNFGLLTKVCTGVHVDPWSDCKINMWT